MPCPRFRMSGSVPWTRLADSDGYIGMMASAWPIMDMEARDVPWSVTVSVKASSEGALFSEFLMIAPYHIPG